jgi:glycosyltransferase involved in cell wall biosynthesis
MKHDAVNLRARSSVKTVVGVIVPIFKIGPILSDTLKSLIDQGNDDIDLRFVLVVDGCPYTATTQEQMRDYLYGAPYPIEVCYKKNEGVSIARNFGVERLLHLFPDVEYVLFFDADDIAPPNYVREAIKTIHRGKAAGKTTIGWAYSDQFQFGAAIQWVRYPRSILNSRFTVNNLSQPTSLVTRELIDKGVRFDEMLTAGIEDWDFWFNAADAGFSGIYAKNAYIKYRRLAGSRSSLNRANDGYTKFYLRNKHSRSYLVRAFLEQEHAETPRYAFWEAQNLYFSLKTAPTRKCIKTATLDNLLKSVCSRARYRNEDAYIDEPYFPDFVVIGNTEHPDCFGALLHAEQRLVASKTAAAAFILNWSDEKARARPWLAILRVSRLVKFLTKENLYTKPILTSDAKSKAASRLGAIRTLIKSLKVRTGWRAEKMDGGASLLEELERTDNVIYLALHDTSFDLGNLEIKSETKEFIRALKSRCAPFIDRFSGRELLKERVVGNPRSTHWDISAEAIGVKHIYPWLPDDNQKALLGVVGGDAAIMQAAELLKETRETNQRLAMHHFVPRFLSKPNTQTLNVFNSTTQLFDYAGEINSKTERFYNGTPLWEKAVQWNAMVVNAMSACDYIINVGCIEATLGIAALKRYGLKTCFFYFPTNLAGEASRHSTYTVSEHLVAYTGVYDKIIVDDEMSISRLRALGVPRSKVIAYTGNDRSYLMLPS